MKFATTPQNGFVVLHITGELDAVSVPDLRSELDRIVAEGHNRVVVDLTGLRLIDSSGVGAIVSLYRRLRDHGGTVTVEGATEQPLAVLKLLKLDRLLLGGDDSR
jgi:anti-sigma B factor antagonist